MFNLNAPDFTTAQRVATTINTHLGPGTAAPVDATSVEVSAPEGRAERIAFLSIVENLQVSPDAAPARVVVNSRSGTIVIGNEVRVERAAVAHGNLVVTVSEDFEVSQPAPFTRSPGAATAVVPDSEVTVETEDARMFLLEPGVTLQELVTAVNNVGAAPGDLIAILEALQQAGALRAQLIVI
jgi:flagellar P-ring protein precursor FlgI